MVGQSTQKLSTSESRLERARALAWPDTGKRDVKGALALFDPSTDSENADWCNVVGVLRDDSDSRETYDKVSALQFLARAANLGSPPAYYNLAVRAERGYYGPIDQRLAAHLYRRAADLGHMCAGSNANHYGMQDHRYGRTGNEVYTAEVDAYLAESAARGGPWAIERYARSHAGDPYNHTAIEKMLGLYKVLVDQDERLIGCKAAKPRAVAARRMAIRSYLGIDVPWDFGAARQYLEAIPNDHWETEIKYGSRNFADKLTFNLDRYSSPNAKTIDRGSNRGSAWDEMVAAGALTQELYKGGKSFSDFVKQVRFGEILTSVELADQLGFVASLAREEGWKTRQAWSNALASVQASLLNTTLEAVTASTQLTGPKYNKCCSDTGFEVPGAYLAANASPRTSSLEHGAPGPGITRVLGLRAMDDGSIDFDLKKSDSTPALILREDMTVCFALAFGDPLGVIWPSFSLEPHEKMTPEKIRWVFERKEWTPDWLGHTAFGRTLYYADVFIGRLAFQSAWFGTEPEKFGVSTSLANRSRQILQDLSLAGGRDDGLWSRVMLAPLKVDFEWRSHENAGIKSSTPFFFTQQRKCIYKCSVKKVEMRVEGSNCVTAPDGSEVRNMNLDDPDFSAGRAALLITKHYDELAIIFPLLERARQMMTLQHMLFQLRLRGFKLNRSLQEQATTCLRDLKQMPKLGLSKLLTLR